MDREILGRTGNTRHGFRTAVRMVARGFQSDHRVRRRAALADAGWTCAAEFWPTRREVAGVGVLLGLLVGKVAGSMGDLAGTAPAGRCAAEGHVGDVLMLNRYDCW
jgi:hypothetical protein